MDAEPPGRTDADAPESPFGSPRQVALDWLWFGLPYLVAAVLCLVLAPSGHSASAVGAPAAVLLFIAALQFELRLSVGWVACQQAAFVVMLFTLPLNVVPLAAYASLVAAQLIKRRPLWTLVSGAGDCWYTIPAVVVLALFAKGVASWTHWPIYVAAFAAQLLLTEALQVVRFRVAGHTLHVSEELTTLAVDAMLTPIGLIAAVSVRSAPGASIAALAGVTGLLALLGREHKERRSQTERALRDPLTGLANRALFTEAIDGCLARCQRQSVQAGLLLLDLDDFKQINDTHGHQSGDQALAAFAVRLRAATRAVDVVARLGGDEFAVIVAEPITPKDLQAVAVKLCDEVSGPFTLSGGEDVELLVSAGVAVLGAESTVNAVMTEADRSLYESKRARGRG